MYVAVHMRSYAGVSLAACSICDAATGKRCKHTKWSYYKLLQVKLPVEKQEYGAALKRLSRRMHACGHFYI